MKLNDTKILLDGAMGTALQQAGIQAGTASEELLFTRPELVRSVHRRYVDAGSGIIFTNTFGANRFKLRSLGRSVAETVSRALMLAREAADGRARVALDIGPLGRLLEPLGTLSFEEAYECFAEIVEAGSGADLIVIETMADLYEVKAALLAAKEHSSLPVLVSMSFESNKRTYTGCTATSFARTATALGADAVGLNCSLGPAEAAEVIRELAAHTTLPLICKPNAGLPDPLTGAFSLGPRDFAEAMRACVRAGATLIGGCCGTTETYISALSGILAEPATRETYIKKLYLCTPTAAVPLDCTRVVGERLNPTGKKRLQTALKEKDMDLIAAMAVSQTDAGAEILDVNAGHPEVKESELLPCIVKSVQAVTSAPLMIDSTDPEAVESALRVYNGIPAVNSVNGSEQSLKTVLPLVKKYGASVVGLCLDEGGIPKTAGERFAIAKRILDAALALGIERERVFIDCLTLTVSAEQAQAKETLSALRRVKTELGLETVLGVSNISFGLPNRAAVTDAFLAEALQAGLTMPIMNPNRPESMALIAAHRVLSGEDIGCARFVGIYAAQNAAPAAQKETSLTLEQAIEQGLSGEAKRLSTEALFGADPLSIMEKRLIPALDRVGTAYEQGRLFLPGLLSAAKAAGTALDVLRDAMQNRGTALNKGTLALATVKGDIHDIGKNIVKAVLESYGYRVIDLGRDVAPETVKKVVEEQGLRLVGLSALMTTTLPAMKETVRLLKAMPEPPRIVVGGAVVTAEYAADIGADRYAADAGQTAAFAAEVLR